MYYICRAVGTHSVVDCDLQTHEVNATLLMDRWYLCSGDYSRVKIVFGWIRTGWVSLSKGSEGVLLDTRSKGLHYKVTLFDTGPVNCCSQFWLPVVQNSGHDMEICARIQPGINLNKSVPVYASLFTGLHPMDVWSTLSYKTEVAKDVGDMLTVGVSVADGALHYYSPDGPVQLDGAWWRRGCSYVVTIDRDGHVTDAPVRCKGDWTSIEACNYDIVDAPAHCDVVEVPMELLSCDRLPILMRMPDGGFLPYQVVKNTSGAFRERLITDADRCADWVENTYVRVMNILPNSAGNGNIIDTLAYAAQLWADR